MTTLEEKEKKNKRIGWLVSFATQLLLLFIFYFLIAWSTPIPPIPEYGIELGFESSSGASARQVETEENVEQPSQTEAEPETNTVPIESTELVMESEAIAEEAQVKAETATSSQPEVVDERALMKPTESRTAEKVRNPGEGKSQNQEIDSRAIYGNRGKNKGSTDGASLSLAGWIWDSDPKPNDSSTESGKITYEIVVDSDGYLVKIRTITSTVSPAVERKYREALQKLTFSKTGESQVAALSTGQVTFIIKSR